MKKILLCAFTALLTFSLSAQIPDGTVAPNITGVDIDGNSHDLNSILDSGKGVLLDFSATWCGPCWNYHQTHALDLMQSNYGPEGSDEIMVLWLECDDDGTNAADIAGTGSSTQGDWTECTVFPIVDNMESASNAYNIGGYPTIMGVSSNDNTVQTLGQAPFLTLRQYFVDEGIIVLPATDPTLGFACGESIEFCGASSSYTPELDLTNLGTEAITEATFEIYMNGVLNSTEDWTGNVAMSSTESVTLAPIPLSGSAEIEIVVIVDGDGNMNNNSRTIDVVQATATTESFAFIEITTDNYGEETYWHVEDEAGTIIASGGNSWVGTTNIGVGSGAPQQPAGTYGAGETYEETVIFDQVSCYNFVITDYWGDGICCAYGNGSYKIEDNLGNDLIEGGSFGAVEGRPFENTLVSGLNDIEGLNEFSVYPNPTNEILNINVDMDQTSVAYFEIFNLVGEKVFTSDQQNIYGFNNIELNVTDLSVGMYTLNMVVNNQTTSTKFSVIR